MTTAPTPMARNLDRTALRMTVVKEAVRRHEEDGVAWCGHVTGSQVERWMDLFESCGWTPPEPDVVGLLSTYAAAARQVPPAPDLLGALEASIAEAKAARERKGRPLLPGVDRGDGVWLVEIADVVAWLDANGWPLADNDDDSVHCILTADDVPFATGADWTRQMVLDLGEAGGAWGIVLDLDATEQGHQLVRVSADVRYSFHVGRVTAADLTPKAAL